jgi:hypothetical protein
MHDAEASLENKLRKEFPSSDETQMREGLRWLQPARWSLAISYSPKGMHKSAQGCAATHYPGKRSVPIRSIPEGDEYAERHLFSIPFRELGRWLYCCPRVAAGPQPWADLCIPFGERDASLHEISIEQRNAQFTRNAQPCRIWSVSYGVEMSKLQCAGSSQRGVAGTPKGVSRPPPSPSTTASPP